MNETAPSASSLAIAARYGRYRLLRRLGQGGMGEVFEAEHVDLGTRVAIKLMHPDISADESAVRALLREGRAAAAIRHPNVVQVLDVGTEQGRPYLVMELLEGEDLAKRLRREGALTAHDALDFILPILSGLAAAHQAGVIHRDLKPSNVVLAQRRGGLHPVVVDFGISKVLDPRSDPATSSVTMAGTPQYMAPEQLRRRSRLDGRCDQYALGVILYECLTGGSPFWAEDYYDLLHAVMTASVVPPSTLNPQIPVALDAVLLRAIARRPEDRYPDVGQLAVALLPFARLQTATSWQPEFAAPGELQTGFARGVPTRAGLFRRSRSAAFKLPAVAFASLAFAAFLATVGGLMATRRPEARRGDPPGASAAPPAPGAPNAPPPTLAAAPEASSPVAGPPPELALARRDTPTRAAEAPARKTTPVPTATPTSNSAGDRRARAAAPIEVGSNGIPIVE
jgi:tRNA A-37 threonylcarbamoyl transferase component Bud32